MSVEDKVDYNQGIKIVDEDYVQRVINYLETGHMVQSH
jgi:hypothetical protein